MLFNSLDFALFLPLVFLLYWFLTPSGAVGPRYSLFHYWHVPEHIALRAQNALVVIASYVFYGWWDWRFLLLIAFTSLCSWGSGLLIDHAKNHLNNTWGEGKGNRLTDRFLTPKFWMVANIIINIAILATFKYYNFFVAQFCQLFNIDTNGLLLKIILPVGISFYTFQALSYSIDVYRGKISPTRDITAFFAFISFFPQLVAGPIERATNLLPQFLTKRTFSYAQATDGMRQILWGLFKKIVVADNCATYVDMVWGNYGELSGSTLMLASVFFTFQIYGDFSGYSDIAIGTAKLFGIRLMRNFNNPYFSRDIAEFWRRWHISLTTWFRDYVYIPLGGSRPEIPQNVRHPERYKKWIIVRNTFVIFLLSGFWHGANWTFIAWGAYHACLFLPLILLGKNRKYTNQIAVETQPDGTERLLMLPTWKEALQMLTTFALVVIGWIIFRAETIQQAGAYIIAMLQPSLFTIPHLGLKKMIPILIVLIITEFYQRSKTHNLDLNHISSATMRISIYIILTLFIFINIELEGGTFIYFQF